jgi:hypothetical protein
MPETRNGSWKHLEVGQVVKVIEEGVDIGYGTVDDSMTDGSIVWVVIHGIGARRMLHKNDSINIQLVELAESCSQNVTSTGVTGVNGMPS